MTSTLPTPSPPTKGKFDIDLSVRPICSEGEKYLAALIGKQSGDRRAWMHQAKRDFDWANCRLLPYMCSGQFPKQVRRATLGDISSGEWMNGVLCSGNVLDRDHVRILMFMINPKTGLPSSSSEMYVSGKEGWKDAPESLRVMLDCLDDACVAHTDVTVKVLEVE